MVQSLARTTGTHPGDVPAPLPVDHRPARPGDGNHSLWLLAMLSLLMGFASISTDIYLPALPVMATDLRAEHGSMALTLSSYLAGFSIGQLLWGPIGDRFGRRGPIAFGLVLFVIGSAGCALASNVDHIIAWRVVQALGACAGPVLARAMVRDLYARERAAQMLSTLMTVMALAPLLGPIVGGQVLEVASWRAIFWGLVVFGFVSLAAIWSLPETLAPERRNDQGIRAAIVAYGVLLREKRLMGYALVGGMFYGGAFAYIAGTPFTYITYYHVSPQLYGVVFALGVVGIMATNMVNTRGVVRLSSDRMLRIGTIAAAASGALAALAGLTGWGGLTGLVVPLFLYMAASGFIVANSVAGALSAYPNRAGAASALVGAIHYGSGVLSAALVGWCADGTPWPMTAIVGVGGIGCLAVACVMLPTGRTVRAAARNA